MKVAPIRLKILAWIPLAALCSYALVTQYAQPLDMTQSTQAWGWVQWIAMAILTIPCVFLLHYAAARADRRTTILTLLWGLALALCYLVGQGNIQYADLWPHIPALASIARFAGLALFFTAIARAFLRSPWGEKSAPQLSKTKERLWFFVPWLIIFTCWIPYYLSVYPGILSVDSMRQFEQAYDLADMNNAHPLVHTLLLRLALWVGDSAGWEYRFTYGLITLSQMAALSAVMAYCIVLLRKHVRNNGLCLFALLNFALNPLHAFFSVTIWKDIPFSACVLLLALLIFRVVLTRGAVLRGWGFRIAFAATSLGVMLLRNNGILPLLFSLILLVILWRPNRVFFAVITGVSIAVYLLLNAALYPLLEIQQGSVIEALSSPIQQIARVVWSEPETLTEEQAEMIEYVFPIEALQKEYNPTNTDSVKFSPNFYAAGVEEDLSGYAALWLDIVRTHPKTTLTAHLVLTSAFWYPDRVPRTMLYYPSEVFDDSMNYLNDWLAELDNEALVPAFSFLTQYLKPDSIAKHTKVFNLLLLPGILIWIAFLALVCLSSKRKRRYMLVTLPMLGVWGCLMLGAPLSDSRYSYPFYLMLPLLLGLCWLSKSKDPALMEPLQK